jgi:hypothetical protein
MASKSKAPPEERLVQRELFIPHRYYRLVRNAMFVLGILFGASAAMVITFIGLVKGGMCR